MLKVYGKQEITSGLNVGEMPLTDLILLDLHPAIAMHWKNVPGYIRTVNYNSSSGQNSCEMHNDTDQSGGQILEYQFNVNPQDQITFSCYVKAQAITADWHTLMAIQQAQSPYATYAERKAEQSAISGTYYSIQYTAQKQEKLTSQIKLRNGQGTIWVDEVKLIIQRTSAAPQPVENKNLELKRKEKELAERKDNPSFTFNLLQNYPNPFNPETWIPFSISEPGNIEIQIFNIQGKLIKRISMQNLEEGQYQKHLDGRAGNGESRDAMHRAPSGIYFYCLIFKNNQNKTVLSKMKKMVIMK